MQTSHIHIFNRQIGIAVVINIIVIALAYWQSWPAGILLWTYWFHSVIIGLRHALRFAVAPVIEPSTQPGLPFFKRPNHILGGLLAAFFIFHYGFFHAVYAIFLSDYGSPLDIDPVIGIAFLVQESLQFIAHYRADQLTTLDTDKVYAQPYKRIVPMHLIILFGFVFLIVGANVSIVFLIFVAVSDIWGEIWQQKADLISLTEGDVE